MDYLGNDYIVKNIDLEPCIYRDFGSYDVEISGGYYTRPFRIYVWQTKPYMRIMEQYDMPSRLPCGQQSAERHCTPIQVQRGGVK